jgi:hypothetical protein
MLIMLAESRHRRCKLLRHPAMRVEKFLVLTFDTIIHCSLYKFELEKIFACARQRFNL